MQPQPRACGPCKECAAGALTLVPGAEDHAGQRKAGVGVDGLECGRSSQGDHSEPPIPSFPGMMYLVFNV